MITRTAILALAIVVVLSSVPARAQSQPSEPRPPAPKQEAPRDEAQDREAMKARLERWLSETKQRQERIEAALKSLNQGASTDEVRQKMEPPMRGDRPPNGGGGGGRSREGGPAWGGPPPRGDQKDGRPGPDPQAEREQVLGFIKQHNPEMYERITKALKENPEAGERVFGRLVPQIREALYERDPATRELRIAQITNGWEIFAAARQFGEATRKGADAADLAARTTAVKALLGKQFDIQLQLHEREIATLEQRLADLKKEVSDSQSNREKYINDRIEMMKRGPGRGPRSDEPGRKKPEPAAAGG